MTDATLPFAEKKFIEIEVYGQPAADPSITPPRSSLWIPPLF
jgi:hypothetical protein